MKDKSDLSSEKELLNEELRLAYARVSELEIFIDRMKLGQKPKRSVSSDQLSKSNQSLSKSASNLRPFDDESHLGESSNSLHNLAMENQPSKSEASLHHAALLEDLTEKQQIIDKLEEEIDQLREELDKAQSGAANITGNKKSVDSLLHDISERENQIFIKDEELFDLQNQVEQLRKENQSLKDKLSEVCNSGFDLTNPETYTIEEPVTTVSAAKSFNQSKTETELQMEQLIERSKTQDEVIEKLQDQVKLLKENQVRLNYFYIVHICIVLSISLF